MSLTPMCRLHHGLGASRARRMRIGITAAMGVLMLASGLAWSSPASASAASWTSIGGTGNGWGNGNVLGLVAVDATHVYAGGYGGTNFTTNSRGFMTFNGTSWSATAGGPTRVVNAIARAGDDTFYVGGDGGVTGYIRKWDGTTWSALAGGANGDVFAIAIDGAGRVFAGGVFTRVNDGSADVADTYKIAMWDPVTSTWSPLGRGLKVDAASEVHALAVDSSGNLYLGGQFAHVVDAAGNAVPNTANIAKWNGTSWSAVGAGASQNVDALAADSSGNIYAGGTFTSVSNSGGVVANTSAIARWNGSSWSAMGAGFDPNTFNVTKLAVSPTTGRVYAVSNNSGVTKVWAGGAWSDLPDIGGQNWSVAVDSAERLYVGGQFLGKIQRLDMSTVPFVTGVTPNAGPASGGTQVTITGTGFDTSLGGTAFSFGGATCGSVVVTSSTSASCVTAPHAVGTVDDSVTANGVTTNRSQSFTYLPGCLDLFDPTSPQYVGGTPGKYACAVEPSSTQYAYTVRAGRGGDPGSAVGGGALGARVVGTTPVTSGAQLDVVVGSVGARATSNGGQYRGGSGGGFSSVAAVSGPLVVAGGGGGSGNWQNGSRLGGAGGVGTAGDSTGGTGTPPNQYGSGGSGGVNSTGGVGGFNTFNNVQVGGTGGALGAPGANSIQSGGGGGGAGYSLSDDTGGSTSGTCTLYASAPGAFGGGGAACMAGGGGGGYSGGGGGGGYSESFASGGGGGGGGSSLIPAGAAASAYSTDDTDKTSRVMFVLPASAVTVTGIQPSIGALAGNQTVTIGGTNFVTGAAVTVGGVACTSVSVTSPSQLTCTIGAHAAGVVDVEVTVPSGLAGVGRGIFTYAPAPDLTAINPATGTAAGGTSVTLSGTYLSGTTAVTFGGTNATSFLVVDDSTITAITPPKAQGVYDVAVVTPAGDDSLAAAFTYTATPSPLPGTPPSAPRDVRAVGGEKSAVVSWREPVSAGSFPVTTYKATSAPEGKTCLAVAPSLTCTVTGLANGTPYTFTVEALNGAGWSPKGGPSAPVTPGGPTPAPEPQPLPAPLPPGGSVLQTNGVVDPNVKVDPNTKSDGLVISGDGWNMDLDGLGPDGKPLNLGPDGSLRLANERDVATEGTGFLPNSEVDLYVDPPVLLTGASARVSARAAEAVYVGTVKTDARGNFTGTATLPEDILPGDHVLQAVGYSPSKQSRAMSLGVIVDPWILLDQGTRTAAGMHDRIRTTGSSGGIDAGVKLTPWIRYAGQGAFKQGVASITVQSDGSFRWTREIRKSKGLTAYVSYVDVESNRVFWAKVR